MKALRGAAGVYLAAVFLVAAAAPWLAPYAYDRQFRESPEVAPCARFLLGTDALGRDRLSRLIYGTQVSLLLAPAAALLATAIATGLGLLAGYGGKAFERVILLACDLLLALPRLFLLLMARAALPLNVDPWASVALTMLLLGLLGWGSGARVLRAGVVSIQNSGFTLQARALGIPAWRVMFWQILPHLRPVAVAQFWTTLPVFVLAEANLGFLGLGVTEPLPSWGGLLAELQNVHAATTAPWTLAPAFLLVTLLGALSVFLTQRRAAS